MEYPELAGRVAVVREVIRERQAAGGWTHPVTIVAVTKTLGPEAIRAAWGAGLVDIGENRVQEALAKQDLLPAEPGRWHLIGSLQRNKVRQVVGRFHLIHSVDRVELAMELQRRLAPERRQAVLVEVNCSGEMQKAGVGPGDLPRLLEVIRGLDHLDLRGLMTMAPLTRDEDVQRRVFHALRSLRDSLRGEGHDLPDLSMGMSGDYPMAVEEGATMVRLGTLLFGERGQ